MMAKPPTAYEQMRERQREDEIVQTLSGEPQAPHAEPAPAVRRKPFERKPFGTWDQKLAYPSREGFHRHWFNDEPGRIIRARDAGYTHVEDEQGRPVQTVVGIGRGGQPLVAFLLELPEEYFREDMAAQESAVHGLMSQIGKGDHSRPGGQDGSLRYSGSSNWGDIKIEAGNQPRRR